MGLVWSDMFRWNTGWLIHSFNDNVIRLEPDNISRIKQAPSSPFVSTQDIRKFHLDTFGLDFTGEFFKVTHESYGTIKARLCDKDRITKSMENLLLLNEKELQIKPVALNKEATAKGMGMAHARIIPNDLSRYKDRPAAGILRIVK